MRGWVSQIYKIENLFYNRTNDRSCQGIEGKLIKIVLISDVHANLPALEAVFEHAGRIGYDFIWNLGDYVGYGPYPQEVVQVLRNREALAVVGNYDLKVLDFDKKKKKWKRTKNPIKYQAFRWARRHLDKKSRAYLAGLPLNLRVPWQNRRILLTHASPDSKEEPISPLTSSDRLRELGMIAEADLILSGHSHQEFQADIDHCQFINPGSVGRPGDGDPRASYALLEMQGGRVRPRFFRVTYDVDRTVGALREKGLPEIFEQVFLQGRSLDDLE